MTARLAVVAEAAIPVVLCLDVEPDGRGHVPHDSDPWAGAEELRGWLTDVRARSEELTGAPARVSWFVRMDPQVEEAYGRADHAVTSLGWLADVEQDGDELGLHVHAWRRTADGWRDDYADRDWVRECIDRSFAAFADAFGRPCRLSRMGFRYLDETAVERLAERGAEIDLTAEPAQVGRPDGWDPHLRGALPDQRKVPRRPHRLAPGLVSLPLSATRKRLGLRPYAHLSRMRRHGLRERLDQPLPFGLRVNGRATFGELVRRSLAAQRRPYLAFAIRSGDGVVAEHRARRQDHLDQLLSLPEAPRFRFVTPTEALRALT